MILPMFLYNPGSGVVQWVPTYPPIGKQPDDCLEAIRHDSITSSGIKQAVLERLDDVMTLSFPFVPVADLVSWKAFMTFALAGGVFAYRQNSTTNAAWGEYTLDSQEWTPKFVCFGTFSFEFKCRLWVGQTIVSGS